MDFLAHRVAARWKTGSLKILNPKGEYPTKLLQAMTEAVIKKMGAGRLKFVVRFGPRASSSAAAGAGGEHVKKGGKHVLWINNTWRLQTQVETIAHEIQHAIQEEEGRLLGGYAYWTWEGEKVPVKGAPPHGQRPWEREAIAAEHFGTAVYNTFLAKGLIPKKRSEQLMDEIEAEGKIPARGKRIVDMTEDEIREWARQQRP